MTDRGNDQKPLNIHAPAVPNEPKNELTRQREIVADGLMDVPEACEFLSISKSKLYEIMQRGELPYSKIDGCRRIPRRALVGFAAERVILPQNG